jgi:hypothetical protein
MQLSDNISVTLKMSLYALEVLLTEGEAKHISTDIVFHISTQIQVNIQYQANPRFTGSYWKYLNLCTVAGCII